MAEKNVSALDMSERTGIPRTTLGRRLKGTSSFTVFELASIADSLGVSMVEVIQRSSALTPAA